MQHTRPVIYPGKNIDSVLCVYTIASACQDSCLQEVEFSLKAFIYLPGRNAAARVSTGSVPAHPRHGAEPSAHGRILGAELGAATREGWQSCQRGSSEISGNFKTQTFIMSTTFCKCLAPDKKDWNLHMPNLWGTSWFVPMWTFFWNKLAFILEWNVYTGIYSCHGSCVNKP